MFCARSTEELSVMHRSIRWRTIICCLSPAGKKTELNCGFCQMEESYEVERERQESLFYAASRVTFIMMLRNSRRN